MPGSLLDCVRPSRWRSRIIASLIVAALISLLNVEVAFAQPKSQPQTWVFPDELLVGFHAGVRPADAEDTYRPHGGVKLETLDRINVHRVRVPASAIQGIQQALARRPHVKFVERNRLHPPHMPANDPYYSAEWHLSQIAAPSAWDLTQGVPQLIIAILDSGVDPSHPDLAAKLVPGYNFYNGNTNTADVYGHGTLVAGAAAAIGNNDLGVASVAWQNGIMPIRVTGTDGWATTSAIANGLTWAVDHGARVMNVSFGGVAGSITIRNAAQYVVSRGGVVVAAAGNCGCWDATPDNPYIISVSATDGSDNLAYWSSRGDYVNLSAPGVGIITTAWGGGYASVSGTSFSSPITAGVVALMMSVNPSLTPAELETLLRTNADDLGSAGWDSSFGSGRVNAARAVAAAAGSAPTPDTTPPGVSIASPTSGSTVTGGVTVSVSAFDDTGLTRVDLYIDGNLYASDSNDPYTFYWDTTTGINGLHTLTAMAYDAAGNAAVSAAVGVSVENSADTTAPSVAITSVVAYPRRLIVQVSATDNVGVAKVKLFLDGVRLATDASSPYTFSLRLDRLSPGTHALQARAVDAAGNVGYSNIWGFTK